MIRNLRHLFYVLLLFLSFEVEISSAFNLM